MATELIGTGVVGALAVNGLPQDRVHFTPSGPESDKHSSWQRGLSGHDDDFMLATGLPRGARVFNRRQWTALSVSEIGTIGAILKVEIPVGCLLENIRLLGFAGFSLLSAGHLIVFRGEADPVVLEVAGGNAPCGVVGGRLEQHHGIKGLSREFVTAAKNRRGLTGFVIHPGFIATGDRVDLYAPIN